MRQNETLGLPGTHLYILLVEHLRRRGDHRTPEQIITLAVRNWLADQQRSPPRRGYQWKELFLPDGTELRIRYMGMYYYACVEGDRLTHGGEPTTPRRWMLDVTGCVHNAWRDVWIRRTPTECWTRAGDWRASNAVMPALPWGERRQRTRRSTD